MNRIRRSIAIAALFGIPPGVGVSMATLRVTGGENVLLATIAGVVVTISVMGVVIGLSVSGAPDPPPEGPYS